MAVEDDSLEELNIYLSESREHLANIEADLLAIEEAGESFDEKQVNKVFRAAHSIKGGAGFFGLAKIQELGHKIENILDMIRAREMVPSPEVINILLLSFDKLREMVHTPGESNQADIGEFIQSLTRLTSDHLSETERASLTTQVEVSTPSGGFPLQVSEFDLSRAEKRDEFVYLIEIDLIHDVQRRGKTPWEVFKDYLSTGTILDCVFNFAAVGTLDDESTNQIPMEFLFSTVIDPSFIHMLFEGIAKDKIRLVREPKLKQPMLSTVDSLEPLPVLSPEIPVETEPVVEEAKPAPPPEKKKPEPAIVQSTRIAPQGEKKPAPKAKSPVADRSSEPAPAALIEPGMNQPEETLRVNVSLLENLMTLASELVLSRNQLQEAIRRGNLRDLRASGQRINLVTSELQEAIMLTRMQPIGTILTKFPRVVRDLARDLNKDVRLDIFGKEVELDKTIIEGLSEPLTHMVRNSVDHGIEPRDVRLANGKPPTGKITIRAYHSAGQVVVEIFDDGAGINADKITEAAVNRKQITEEQARLMTEKEKLALIFLPGVSTAEKVTDISGRGVGMDVVKTNLDHLGGKIDIESEVGAGTTFRVSLPLTLAIIPSLLVSVGEERFAIPQINISELIHVPANQVKTRIEVVGDAEVLILRGKLVPVVRLADLLSMDTFFTDPQTGEVKTERRRSISDRRSRHTEPLSGYSEDLEDGYSQERRKIADRRYHASSDLEIVVINTGVLEYGLIVAQLHDTVEIVVRPLGRHIKQVTEYGGATILGDGRVALILDAAGLASKAHLVSLANTARARELSKEYEEEKDSLTQSLLLFHNAPDETCAMPLNLVDRVEHIEIGQVEGLGGKRTMQYRGASLPLMSLGDVAMVGSITEANDLAVIVLRASQGQIGLLVSTPVDAIDTQVKIDTVTLRQHGIAGSAIIEGTTTLMVDAQEMVGPDYQLDLIQAENEQHSSLNQTTILLAEDSDFFRRQVSNYMEEEGFHVLSAPDGQAAWELLLRNVADVRLVLTDIEMPELNGLELTQRIRAEAATAHLPVIALTSLAGEEEIQRGLAAGVDLYEIKLDREKLISSVHELLSKIESTTSQP